MLRVSTDFLVDSLSLAIFSDTDETKILLKNILEIYTEAKKKDASAIDDNAEMLFGILCDVVENDLDLRNKTEINNVIFKIKNSELAKRDHRLVESITNLFNSQEELSQRRINKLIIKLRQWVTVSRATNSLKQMWGKCNNYNSSDVVTNDLLINELMEHARDITKIQTNGDGMSNIVDFVDMTNKESVKRAVKSYRTRRDLNVFKSGLKGLNKMLGEKGGFTRGEFWAFAAASHNYKSGILMAIARWCATLSNFKVEPGQTPAVVLISLENQVPENVMNTIREAYVDAYKAEPPKDMTDDEIIDIVVAYYNKNGVKLLIYKFDEDFGYNEFVALQSKLKAANYTVIASIIDYITLMKIDENTRDNPAKMLQKLAQKIYNFAHNNNQLVVTGLQLDTEAERIIASGQTNVVKRFGAAHLGDCKGLRREVDGLIFMHIESNTSGVPYLTFAWSKHRNEVQPKKADQYCAYRYCGEILGLMDDIHLPGNKTNAQTDIYSDNSTGLGETTDINDPFALISPI